MYISVIHKKKLQSRLRITMNSLRNRHSCLSLLFIICAASLTELLLLMGNLAMFFPNQEWVWDSETMEVNGLPDAIRIIRPAYRTGLSLEA
jgi:hypothetical protein